MSLYHLNVTLHVLAALLWLGGMLFLAAVGAPVLRKVEPPSLRAELFRTLGEQFRLVGWLCILILVVTGVFNLHFRGVLSWSLWTSPDFWSSPFGFSLFWKLAAVTIMLVVSAIHDFVLGPAASKVEAGSPAALRLRRHAALLARVNALVGLGLVFVAVQLARGGWQ